jgi:16S rRNA (guanine527-N7)-methyltransferase
LGEAVRDLQLDSRVRVLLGRAEEPGLREQIGASDWVSARAVAPLDRLVRWCLPMLVPGGRLLAMKGERAVAELAEHRATIRRMGARTAEVVRCGVGVVTPPVAVVVVERA